MNRRKKRLLGAGILLLALVIFYAVAGNINPSTIGDKGASLPLPLFTFLIAFLDGFNPCNFFVLTLLLSLMVAESYDKKRVYAVGYTFVAVVFLFFFIFMVAWFNIFNYIGFVSWLRIVIALIALIAGIFACQSFFFSSEGKKSCPACGNVPLMIRINKISKMINSETSFIALIGASIFLAIFSSMIEIPCTAGFPVVYTGVLTGMVLESSLMYYAYVLLYSVIYTIPLLAIMILFGKVFVGKTISESSMSWIQFISGIIMILLGIVLLINPGLIGIG